MIKIRVPANGPLASFLEVDIFERAAFLRSEIFTQEDQDFARAAQIIRDGWDRTGGVLHFSAEHASVVLDAVNDASNCLDDEIEHAQGDSEFISINKRLIAASLRMNATIIKQTKASLTPR